MPNWPWAILYFTTARDGLYELVAKSANLDRYAAAVDGSTIYQGDRLVRIVVSHMMTCGYCWRQKMMPISSRNERLLPGVPNAYAAHNQRECRNDDCHDLHQVSLQMVPA